MTGSQRAVRIVACSIMLGGCAVEAPTVPVPGPSGGSAEPQVLPVFELRPETVILDEGAEVQLYVTSRTAQGMPLPGPVQVAYSSSAPEVASVTEAGFLTAHLPGSAVISAKTTFASVPYTATAVFTVRKVEVTSRLVLQAQSYGWDPVPAHVYAGGIAEWRTGLIAVSGVAVQTISLLSSNYTVLETFEMKEGVARRTFPTPGTYRYCSNACWDPPEFGIIIVH